MKRILLVGGGLTAASTASLLRQSLGQQAELVLWDKARGAGGRMSTSRSPNDGVCTADLGAQYITATPSYAESHKKFYNDLINSGVLMPLKDSIEGERDHPEGTSHYVTPHGISSIVKHFLSVANADVQFGHHIVDVSLDGTSWKITTSSGKSELFNCVVLTMPVPQILQLKGTIAEIIEKSPEQKQKLENVSYSSRYALALFYKPGVKLEIPWTAKYFYDGPCIKFISVDNRKRGITDPSVGESIIVHTSVPFGLKHLEKELKEVQPIIMEHLKEFLPDLPEPDNIKCQKWRYSQVHKPVDGTPGCMVLHQSPLLVCGGDAFTHSNMDGCLVSALKLTETICKNVSNAKV